MVSLKSFFIVMFVVFNPESVRAAAVPAGVAPFQGVAHTEVKLRSTVVLQSDSQDLPRIHKQVYTWLKFLQGALGNDLDNSIMIDQNAFSITGIVDSGRSVNEKYDVTIRLEALGAFKNAPGVFNILLPRKISAAGIDEFQTKFSACSHYRGSTYWYYFQSSGCVDASAMDLVQGVKFTSELTSNNTVGKFPEYQRIIDDGVIEVSYVFGNEDEVGVSAVEAALTSKIGEGVAISEETFVEGVRRSKDYASGNLIVRVHYFGLKGHFADLSDETTKIFSRYAEGSDVIYYNGHAGLGRNVDALTDSLTFISGQYYFLFINACQPYAYLDPDLFRKSERANPGDLWSKNLDVGSNVRIGSFNYGYDVANLISSLLKFESYLDVLTNLSVSGYPAVMGEEDNPSSF